MAIPTNQRIRRPAEFRRVFSRGNRKSGSYVNVAVLQNELPVSRIGLSVSKRVGHAVTRNLIKRRIRHALADLDIDRGWDVVVTAKPQVTGVSYAVLECAMRNSLRRLGVRGHAESTGSSGASE